MLLKPVAPKSEFTQKIGGGPLYPTPPSILPVVT